LCGKPGKALHLAKGVLDSSVSHGHPVSLCITYLYTATVVLWLRELDWAERLIETLIEVADRYQLKPYRTGGMALKGELLLAKGKTTAALALLKAVLEPLQAEQLNIMLLPAMRAYAEGLARTSEVEAAEGVISNLVTRALTDSPTYLLPELLRTQGEIALLRDPRNKAAAEAYYRKAIEQAQTDGAVGWELRAAISLAKLWLKSARPDEAEELLDRCLSMFTEGADDVGDVAEARNLLRVARDRPRTRS
jgi:predicted ATPase